MNNRLSHHNIPTWLWFFLAIPAGLIAVLLYRRWRGKPGLRRIKVRYIEPDFIPLEHHDAQANAAGAEEDDLRVIEGIGPTIAGLLRNQGIMTFRQLAATPVERLAEILAQVRLNHLADPATWPEQARLAANAEWDRLMALQRTLKGGRRSKRDQIPID